MEFNAKQQLPGLIEWMRQQMKNCYGKTAVIGISGGKDSSVVAALAVAAYGRENVIGVLMPDGIQPDIDYSQGLVEVLGLKHYTFNIHGGTRWAKCASTDITVKSGKWRNVYVGTYGYNNGTAKIVVNGGKFYKFNPADNAAEGAGTSFLAEGYKSVDNGDGTFTVSLTFTNYTSNWITEETDYIKYGYYKDGTRKGLATLYIGVIDTKKNPVKTFEFDVPAYTTEVRITSSKIVYWTEWA